ncbi:Oxidoreductase [Macrophomina phaseolina MS6]|uniref:Oxidoreductase n=1 Tax=Macrophomina phaseolina (strain MS6) TaxID=1126212 RepID=K2S6Q2_MACPH|nr:Oxidoreductase [Macrophomina phaseolina MS6]
MAGYSRRFDASYREAKAKIDAGVIGKPFLVRSQTGDLRDDTGFFVRYAAKNGAIFVDCSIHDIDLAMWYLGDVVPKTAFAIGTLTHHPELAQSRDVDNGVAVLEFWDGKMAYFYCSRTQAHGQDVATEIIGTHGKIMVNLIPRIVSFFASSSSSSSSPWACGSNHPFAEPHPGRQRRRHFSRSPARVLGALRGRLRHRGERVLRQHPRRQARAPAHGAGPQGHGDRLGPAARPVVQQIHPLRPQRQQDRGRQPAQELNRGGLTKGENKRGEGTNDEGQ